MTSDEKIPNVCQARDLSVWPPALFSHKYFFFYFYFLSVFVLYKYISHLSVPTPSLWFSIGNWYPWKIMWTNDGKRGTTNNWDECFITATHPLFLIRLLSLWPSPLKIYTNSYSLLWRSARDSWIFFPICVFLLGRPRANTLLYHEYKQY